MFVAEIWITKMKNLFFLLKRFYNVKQKRDMEESNIKSPSEGKLEHGKKERKNSKKKDRKRKGRIGRKSNC